MNRTIKSLLLAVAMTAMLCPAFSAAKNIDLVTLPKRNSVQLTIYNSADLTLVKESRNVTLKKGLNRLQFSWANTLIDPTSVTVRPVTHRDEIDVLDTVYPGQKPQHLFWNIQSDVEGQVVLEVRYFTSGLTWQMDYVAITDEAEEKVDFRGYVRVFNNSGEEYEDAEVRMIVGKINLVERIAQLAQSMGNKKITADKRREVQLQELGESIGKADAERLSDRQIVKEGVSEYFMFSVEGETTVKNGWSKRMESTRANDIEFDTVYRVRAHQYGPRPVKFFIWKNDVEHKLGDSPLPNGRVRVFRQNSSDGLSFLGQQRLNYVPVQADIEVNLGTDDLVIYTRKRMETARSNFSFHPVHNHVIGWDERQQWSDELRNFRSKPIKVELRLQFTGDVTFTSKHPTTSFDYNTTQAEFDVPPGGSFDYSYRANYLHGNNAKQNRVLVK
jgi:hypothetical protein